jgi:hypothetical protein
MELYFLIVEFVFFDIVNIGPVNLLLVALTSRKSELHNSATRL